MLEVDLHVPETGERRQLVLVDRSGLTDSELESRRAELAKVKIHPRDTDAIRATLNRAFRCYENRVGAEREFVADLLRKFEETLDRQDPRQCEAARLELSRVLDELDNETFL